jgi:hypothetical protein
VAEEVTPLCVQVGGAVRAIRQGRAARDLGHEAAEGRGVDGRPQGHEVGEARGLVVVVVVVVMVNRLTT